ncbi:MAG TPA: hypothetical protein DD706_12270 [Nitrospiraceae bacterium]|nr:hypothetical protein [Nitrospiraceae bacterium]
MRSSQVAGSVRLTVHRQLLPPHGLTAEPQAGKPAIAPVGLDANGHLVARAGNLFAPAFTVWAPEPVTRAGFEESAIGAHSDGQICAP